MFADKVANKERSRPAPIRCSGLLDTDHRELGSEHPSIPGAAITKDNVDDPKFWGNLKAPIHRSNR